MGRRERQRRATERRPGVLPRDKSDRDGPSKGDAKDHGSGDNKRQSNDARTSSKSGNDNGTKQPLTQDEVASNGGWDCGCDANVPVDVGTGRDDSKDQSGPTGVVSPHGSNDNGTDQTPKPTSTGNGNGKGNGNGTDQPSKQHPAVSDDNSHHGDGNGDVSQGSDDNATRKHRWFSVITKQVNIYAPISVWVNGARNHDVTGSSGAGNAARPSDSNWNSRNPEQVRQDWFVRHPNVSPDGNNSNRTSRFSAPKVLIEQINVYAPITVGGEGDGVGHVHQDNSGGTHSLSHNGNGTGRGAAQWHASRSDR